MTTKYNNTTTEMCPECGHEVNIPNTFKVHVCPNCGQPIKPCSMCNMDMHSDCKLCPLDKGNKKWRKGIVEYKGKKYVTLEVPINWIEKDSKYNYLETIADVALWDAMQEDYDNDEREAHVIDNGIYYYADSGIIDTLNDETSIREYIDKLAF